MPSPIAHAAMGCLLYRLVGGDLPKRAVPIPAAGPVLAIGLSWLPDLDFIPGLLLGNARAWHNQGSHSLLATLIVTLLLAPMLQFLLGGELRRWLGLVFACYVMHILMDTGSAGPGVRLLWPFSLERFAPPMPVFAGVRWSDGILAPRLFSNHLWTLINELAFASVLWALVRGLENRRQRAREKRSFERLDAPLKS